MMHQLILLQILSIMIGYILDVILGDPYCFPHFVKWIGNLIALLERKLNRGEHRKAKGVLAWFITAGGSFLVTLGVLWICWMISPWVYMFVNSLAIYQCIAVTCLKYESRKIMKDMQRMDLEKARYDVSMIVGRDTQELSFEQIAKATVETVAENTTDGAVTPLLFMILGTPFAVMAKAINTMDSMIGYRNERYIDYGCFAARCDDVSNYLAARISAHLMIFASFLLGYDYRNARRIYRRDRYNHRSPNSAHTESVAAGALDVMLAGDASYGGVVLKKKTIGDDIQKISADHIRKANNLLTVTALLTLFIVLAIKGAIYGLL